MVLLNKIHIWSSVFQGRSYC